MITVEMAGPTPPKTTQLKPNTIRSMAGYVLHWCVDVDGGKGGFITAQWTRMLDVVVDPTRIYTDPYREFLLQALNFALHFINAVV